MITCYLRERLLGIWILVLGWDKEAGRDLVSKTSLRILQRQKILRDGNSTLYGDFMEDIWRNYLLLSIWFALVHIL